MAKWLLSEAADDDLEEISAYTARRFGPNQARTYTAEIKRGLGIAAAPDFSFLTKPYTTSSGNEFERYDIGRHAVFFTREQGRILIVRILGLNMDFDRHLD